MENFNRKDYWRKICTIILLVFSTIILFQGCSQNPNNEKQKTVATNSCCIKNKSKQDSIVIKNDSSLQSEITCPKCGHKKVETLPTDVCQLSYTCEKCRTVLHPKEGDCCVFCTYGDHKCPSKQ